jgi:hypothetical protein
MKRGRAIEYTPPRTPAESQAHLYHYRPSQHSKLRWALYEIPTTVVGSTLVKQENLPLKLRLMSDNDNNRKLDLLDLESIVAYD